MTLTTYSPDDVARAKAIYAAAYLNAQGDDDARDQAGFAAIEGEFPEYDIYTQLDLLQYAQEVMAEAAAEQRRVAA